jgi:predicted Zn-dependent peptidase
MRPQAAAMLLVASAVLAAVPDDVTEFDLENGIHVITRTIPGEEVEGLSLFLTGGVRVADSDTQGLEAFSLECAMMGSTGFPGHMWRELMDETMAEWTGSYSYDYSRYHLRCLQEDLAVLCLRFADGLLHPQLDPSAVEQVREGMISAALQDMDDPDEQVWLVANRAFMGDHPYRLRPEGTVETLATFTEEDVRRCLGERMMSGNLLITHAGPTPPGELRTMLEESFGAVPVGATVPDPVPPFGPRSDSLALEHDGVLTAFAVVKFPAPPPGDPDLVPFMTGMHVIDEILWQVLRTEHGLTYATFGGAAVYRRSWGYMYVSSPDPLAACSLMAGVMRDAISGPFDGELLEGVVELQRTYDAMDGERMSSQCRILGSGWIDEGDWRAWYRYADQASEVTPEDVRRALDTWVTRAGWGIIADSSEVPFGEFRPWSLRPGGGPR